MIYDVIIPIWNLDWLWVCFSFRETCLARWGTDPDLSLLLYPCRNYILFGLFLAKCKQNAMIPKPWYTKDMIFSPSFASSDTNFNISVLLYWYRNFFATSKQNCSDSESHGILMEIKTARKALSIELST